MAKLESLSDVTGVNSEAHNANNDRLTQAFENTLSRDGSMPNTMNASLDMNGRFILNLPTPSNNSHAATKAYVDGTAIAHPSITQSNVGAALWPQTQAENDASVTPSNYAYPPGDVRRYGAVGDGVTNDTAAINLAFTVSDASGGVHGVVFDTGKIYLVDGLAIAGTGVVPSWIEGNGATLKARTSSATPVLTITNPHSKRVAFRISDIVLDGDNKAPTFKVNGSQFATFRNMRAVKSTTYGFHLKGEASYGIYYNSFENCQAGANAQQNADTGWHLDGTGSSFYIASNTFINCRSQFNKEHGWYMNYANNTFVGCEAEKNDMYGWSIDNSYSVDILGGYSENNHRNWATDGVSDGGTDENFTLTANSTGVRVFGGRHIGTPAGTWTGLGNWYAPNYSGVTEMPNLDTAGKFTVNGVAVRSGGGLGFSGAAAPSGGINGAAGWEVQAAGSQVMTFHASCSTDETGIYIRHNAGGGGVAVERVTVGATDSGGSGYRLLRIPN